LRAGNPSAATGAGLAQSCGAEPTMRLLPGVGSFPLTYCPGRVCLACDHEIPEIGRRLAWGPVTTYAHMDCAHELIADIPEQPT
jgi:hypothetical protein